MNKTQNTTTKNASMGFFGWLGLLFIALKLTGYITWSWWWVLAPFWGPFAFAMVILLLIFVLSLFVNK